MRERETSARRVCVRESERETHTHTCVGTERCLPTESSPSQSVREGERDERWNLDTRSDIQAAVYRGTKYFEITTLPVRALLS